MFLVLATEQMYVGELVVDDIEQSRRKSAKSAETGDRKSKRRKTATAKHSKPLHVVSIFLWKFNDVKRLFFVIKKITHQQSFVQ